jgi:basic membrane lipoprotein Med (substrate-binding protein (PBP1-ABC) superfamily)
LRGAAQAGSKCIGADDSSLDPAASDCLVASAIKHLDRGVALIVADAAAGQWSGGLHRFGLADAAVELAPAQHQLLPEQMEELRAIAGKLAAGHLTTDS